MKLVKNAASSGSLPSPLASQQQLTDLDWHWILSLFLGTRASIKEVDTDFNAIATLSRLYSPTSAPALIGTSTIDVHTAPTRDANVRESAT
jgi:hypothetical protein